MGVFRDDKMIFMIKVHVAACVLVQSAFQTAFEAFVKVL